MRYIFATLVCAGIILLTMFLNYEGLIPGFTEITGAIGSAIGATPSVKAFLEIWLKIFYFSSILGVWRSIAYKERKSIDADTSKTKSSGSQKKGFWFGILTAGIVVLVLAFSGEFRELLRSNENPRFSEKTIAESSELPRSSYSSSAKRTTSGNSYNEVPVYDQTYLYATDNGNTKKKTAPNTGPQEGQKWVADLGSGVKMEFMPINAGSFQMGSKNGESDEKPVHQATLTKPFWMAKTEVTVGQWKCFLEETGYTSGTDFTSKYCPLKHSGISYSLSGNGFGTNWNQPMVEIDWSASVEFCKWLTKKERQAGRLPEGYEYTLPTETEWEYACRAGTQGDYAGTLDSMGWYSSNSENKTHPAASKQPNAWGLYDMHGNVWEWCTDSDFSYWGYPRTNRDYGYGGPGRVTRGGSCDSEVRDCRSPNRRNTSVEATHRDIGFRPIVLQW